jgi:hypothetical protein
VGEVELSLKEAKIAIEKNQSGTVHGGGLRILRAMAVEDKVGIGQIMEYVNYLIKFATLAQSFGWESLLQYDHEYRKGQSQMAFTWGAESAYLMQLQLKANAGPRTSIQDNNRGRTNVFKSKYDPNSGKVICFRYNARQGCTLRGCKFAHVCTTCFQYHPAHNNHAKSMQIAPIASATH